MRTQKEIEALLRVLPKTDVTSQKLCIPCLHNNTTISKTEFLKIFTMVEVLQKLICVWTKGQNTFKRYVFKNVCYMCGQGFCWILGFALSCSVLPRLHRTCNECDLLKYLLSTVSCVYSCGPPAPLSMTNFLDGYFLLLSSL